MEHYRAVLAGFICVALGWGTAISLSAEEFPHGILKRGDVDAEKSGVYRDGERVDDEERQMFYSLGLRRLRDRPPHRRSWTGGKGGGDRDDPSVFHYLLVFDSPLEVGSVLFDSTSVKYLPGGEDTPKHPDDTELWQEIPVHGRGRPRIGVPESRIRAKALLFTDQRSRGRSSPGQIRLYESRMINVAPLAGARARSEYHAPKNFGGNSYRAIDVARGKGSWESTGKNRDGNITDPPVSDVHPQWYILGWNEKRTLHGIYMRDNFGDLRIDAFQGSEDVHPVVGVEDEWQRLVKSEFQMENWEGRWITFQEPIRTRGLRLRITDVRTPKDESPAVARLSALMALSDVGSGSVPDMSPEVRPPPIEVEYEAPQDGKMTMVIENDEGQRIRNVFAREQREAGNHTYGWDLRDLNGNVVEPGTYRWKGISAPRLELRYQLTTYPNVSQHHRENTPWLNGHQGPGGWLADHSPPLTVATGGDNLFFGAPVAEAGVGFIVCDLSGRKRWGIRQFTPWSSGRSLAADGDMAFVEHPGSGHYGAGDAGADRIWAVNAETRKSQQIMERHPTRNRKRGIADMAAAEGKLVLAINAPDDWTADATGWSSVDIENCRPLYSEAREPKKPHEVVPDPRDDFLRLFRLKGRPAGREGEERLTELESTRGPGRRQHIMLSFKEPVPIGSCVFPVPRDADYHVKLSVLKPDAPYPPEPRKRDYWEEFEYHGEGPWDVAVAPPETETRALLITFIKGEDDEIGAILAGDDGNDGDRDEEDDLLMEAEDSQEDAPLSEGDGRAWKGRLKGMRILRRRFRNIGNDADVRVSSGTVGEDGVWHADRTTALSEEDPAVYVMEWDESRSVRGLALKEIDGKKTEIDVFTGGADDEVRLDEDDRWEKVAEYTSPRRHGYSGTVKYNVNAHYLDGTVDFGKTVETRAIRLRVVSQWVSHSDVRGGSVAKGGLGIDPTRCRIFGVAPLQYLGGESEVDRLYAQRLEVIDQESGDIRDEIGISDPTQLAFNPAGRLHGVAGDKVVRIDLSEGEIEPLELDNQPQEPGPITFDQEGNLYVYETSEGKNVIDKFGPRGNHITTIGQPGGHDPGPWNRHAFDSVTDIAVDKEDKLWVVEHTRWPKRVSCWTHEGEFLREYLGPAEYGGGGVLDPRDKERMFYGPLEFEIDWASGTSELKNLTWDGPGRAGEVPVYLNDRTYMVTRPNGTKQQSYAVVYGYEQGRLTMMAAMGRASEFPPLRSHEIISNIGSQSLENMRFLWTDENGDGKVQYEEVDFDLPRFGSLSRFDDELNIHAGTLAFETEGFRENGVPIYEAVEYPTPPGGDGKGVYRMNNGHFYRLGDGVPDAAFTRDGKLRWTYENEGAGVGPFRSASPYTPDQVVCQFYPVGHEVAEEGDLGEFFVVNANFGSWNIWTADGLLAGRIFQDLRSGESISWSMKEHERGMRLDDVALTQEHFNGWFVKSEEDGRYYAVAGKNHASVVEVRGLDRFRRTEGVFEVTEEDRERLRTWQGEKVQQRMMEDARVIDCYRRASGGDKWEGVPGARLSTSRDDLSASFQMNYDDDNLYVRYRVKGGGPFKNAGDRWKTLFISGACVDLMLGTDRDVDPSRRTPVEGDQRVVLSMYQGKPVAVLYDSISPEAPDEENWEVGSATGRTSFDSVRLLEDAEVKVQGGEDDYTIEATLPLSELHVNPQPDMRIRLDWGIHETDAEGATVINRTYWSNPVAPVLADTPSEARLEPHLWGWTIFRGRDTSQPSADDLMEEDRDDDVDVDRLLRGE